MRGGEEGREANYPFITRDRTPVPGGLAWPCLRRGGSGTPHYLTPRSVMPVTLRAASASWTSASIRVVVSFLNAHISFGSLVVTYRAAGWLVYIHVGEDTKYTIRMVKQKPTEMRRNICAHLIVWQVSPGKCWLWNKHFLQGNWIIIFLSFTHKHKTHEAINIFKKEDAK